jgi:hypothetical protein
MFWFIAEARQPVGVLPSRANRRLRVGPYDEAMNYIQDYDMILRLARKNEGVLSTTSWYISEKAPRISRTVSGRDI